MNITDKNKLGLIVWGTKRGKMVFFTDNIESKIEQVNQKLPDIRTSISITSIKQPFYAIEHFQNTLLISKFRTLYDWLGRYGFLGISIVVNENSPVPLSELPKLLKRMMDMYWEKYIAPNTKNNQIIDTPEDADFFIQFFNQQVEKLKDNASKIKIAANYDKAKNATLNYKNDSELIEIIENIEHPDLTKLNQLVLINPQHKWVSCSYNEISKPDFQKYKEEQERLKQQKLNEQKTIQNNQNKTTEKTENTKKQVDITIACFDNNSATLSDIDVNIEIDGMNYNTLKTNEKGEIKISVSPFRKIKAQTNDKNYLPITEETTIEKLTQNNSNLVLVLTPNEKTTQQKPDNIKTNQPKQEEKLITIVCIDGQGKQLPDNMPIDIYIKEEKIASTKLEKSIATIKYAIDHKNIKDIVLKDTTKKYIGQGIIKVSSEKTKIEIEYKFYKNSPSNNKTSTSQQKTENKNEKIVALFKKFKKKIIMGAAILVGVLIIGFIVLNLGPSKPEYNYKALQKNYEANVQPVLKPDWEWNKQEYEKAMKFVENKKKQITILTDSINDKKDTINISHPDSIKIALSNNSFDDLTALLINVKEENKRKLSEEIPKWVEGDNFDREKIEQYIQNAKELDMPATKITELNQFLEKCKTIEKANKVLCKEITDEVEIKKIRDLITDYFNPDEKYEKGSQKDVFRNYYSLVENQRLANNANKTFKEYIRSRNVTTERQKELFDFYDNRKNKPCIISE